jgi:hypothetical protein
MLLLLAIHLICRFLSFSKMFFSVCLKTGQQIMRSDVFEQGKEPLYENVTTDQVVSHLGFVWIFTCETLVMKYFEWSPN